MNPNEKTNLFDKSTEEANYFQLFNFSKFKKIIFPLAIIAVLYIIKQFITNNFGITNQQGFGLLDYFEDFPIWAKTIRMLIDILAIIVLLCWEAIYEKKYDKIKIVLLFGLPSIALSIICTFSDLYTVGTKSPFYLILFIISFFPFYALYGLFRRKILYGGNLSFIGYLIGMIAFTSITALYQKITSLLLAISDLFSPVYTYGSALTNLFIPLCVFYFFYLSDAGFSFKNFVKMPPSTLLSKKKFTFHFSFLFTFLLALHLFFAENLSVSRFEYLSTRNWGFVLNFYTVVNFISRAILIYLVFSQLLLVQLGALRRKPLWIYLLSFVPVVNLFPLILFYRRNIPLTNSDYFIMQESEERKRLLLQLSTLLTVTACGIYQCIKLNLSREDLYLLVGAIILMYCLVLFLRIGIWITLGIIGIGLTIGLLQNITPGFYYFCFASYAAINLYNLHISIFWEDKEWANIDENTENEGLDNTKYGIEKLP